MSPTHPIDPRSQISDTRSAHSPLDVEIRGINYLVHLASGILHPAPCTLHPASNRLAA